MKKFDLSKISADISSWEDLEAKIACLPTEQERGEAFEQFCHAYFVLNPIFQFKEVYRHRDIPFSIRTKLACPSAQDIGIDGVAVTEEGNIFAYQAKFRTDRNTIPSLRELSTFFTVSDRADWRITITNANKLPKSINDRAKQSQILSDKFDQLDESFFRRLAQYLDSQTIPPPQRRTPHQTQQEAIDAALSYFKSNNRGQLILPCGTGKTLAALWIAEKLGGSHILVMVPSLALMSQSLREWAVNTSIKPFRYLCLCSDPTVDLEKQDSFVTHLHEMEVPVTTDVDTVAAFLKKKTAGTSVLFSTYQSGRVLSEAALASGIEFDLAIFDEAHRTTGAKAGTWNLAIDDNNVPARLRIFMTATPRIYAPHVTEKAKENDILICSMDDEKLYGKPFYEMTFGEAIKRGHITDYKIVVICVTDKEVQRLIQKRGKILADEQEWDANALAKRVAIVKGIHEYGLRKVFTFHSRVKSAKAFTSTDAPHGIEKVFEMVSESALAGKESRFLHVNGEMSTGTRSEIMKEFKKADLAIMSNAHCLTEGVDVPAVDTVAFIDPKQSLIDIVQASGRALRRFEESSSYKKDKGYIFIPVVISEDADPEMCLESSDFKAVWNVLQAMSDQDQRLQDIVSRIRILDGEGKKDSAEWNQAMREYSEKIDFYNIPKNFSKTKFVNALYVKSIDTVGNTWDFLYGLTLAYMKENDGDPNSPALYVTTDGYNLGTWQSTQRANYKEGNLSPDRIKRLEDIGFIWGKFDAAWEEGFEETIKYKELNSGDPNALAHYVTTDGYKLGDWQSSQRANYKKANLAPDRIKRLEDIGFIWNLFDNLWEEGFEETLKYKELNSGDPNAPDRYVTPDGYKLGSWQNSQRKNYNKGNLSPNRIKRLENIGFIWNQLDAAWEKGFEETLKYKELNSGNPNATRYVKTDRYKLGIWQRNQRISYNKGNLSPDRIKRLEDIGFIWNQPDATWEKGIEETLKYKELNYGDPNVPYDYVTTDGYKLGSWQSVKRKNYNKENLSPDRIKRLEDIGFIWNPFDYLWEKGFEETLKYKELNSGDPNASHNYVTSDGYNLGTWQSSRRANYKKGNLSPDRIKLLEDIGFIWNQLDTAWDKGFKETLKYKELNSGNPNAPRNYVTTDGYKLGEWQSHQRANYNKGNLSPDRIKRLEDIGFIWWGDQRDTAWEKGFEETLKFKELNSGDPNAPQCYATKDGCKLGIWQNSQRNNCKKGKLSPDRIKRLESIGFKWKLK